MMQLERSLDFSIEKFESRYQQGIEDLVLPIQTIEFRVAITRDEQSDLLDIPGTFQKGAGNFWVAIHGEDVIGSIGIVDMGNGQAALKKMFARSDCRGKEIGVSTALIDVAKKWCLENQIKTIFLGTVPQLKPAHRFYEENGFVQLAQNDLPGAFPLVSVDTVFYRCDLNGGFKISLRINLDGIVWFLSFKRNEKNF